MPTEAKILSNRLRAYQPEVLEDMQPVVKEEGTTNERLVQHPYWQLTELSQELIRLRQYLILTHKEAIPFHFTIYYIQDREIKSWLDEIEIQGNDTGFISDIKKKNENKLNDQDWMKYQQEKGKEFFEQYKADMNNLLVNVLPYLQTFCSDEPRVIKETGKKTEIQTEKPQQTQAIQEKKSEKSEEKKKSIHERLKEQKAFFKHALDNLCR